MSTTVRVTQFSLMRYSIGLVAVALALLFAWPGLYGNLFATSTEAGGFMPHSHCYMLVPSLVRLHWITDLVIGVSYVAISLTLVNLIHRTRRDIPFHWVFIAFGLFIVACGMTHFMEVWTLDNPTYWLSGYVKLITAAASLATAVILPPLIPRTVVLVSDAKAADVHRRGLESAHAELEQLYVRVKEVDELKTSFFANVSHELRTPLALILGPVEKLLAADNLTAEQRRALEVVGLHSRSLLKQVNDLLDISKLEAGRMGVEYSEVDLARLMRLTASHFESLAAERDIAFRLETPDERVGAEADPDKLERVLLNLLANAFKFTPREGSVLCRLRTVDGGDAALIEVEDTGPGVAPEARGQIFERYVQASADVTHRFGGTGLGLAIAKEFVELHNGSISVDDAPGGGALFRVRIPLAAPAGATIRASGQRETSTGRSDDALFALEELRASVPFERRTAARAVAGASEKRAAEDGAARARSESMPLVLVVEDNVEMNRFVTETLAGEYRVESAFDGREGLERAVALLPDLILSDVMMPQMSGDLLVRELRARPELDGVPVVMLTAKADDELRVRLLREGAQDYLMKPFSTEELRARVAQQVSVKRTREVLRREVESRTEDIEGLARELARRKREAESALDALRESEDERAAAFLREQEARAAAEEASRLKDDFLATVSHELRTPLTPIMGWGQMLLDGHVGVEMQRGALETIMRSARLQQQIVEDLLDVSRIISGKLRFDSRAVALATVVEVAVEAAQPAAHARGLELSVEVTGATCEVSGDAERLQQVFSNLISNGLKFTPRGGRVSVRLARTDSVAEITVSDNGIGISPDFLPHVFDRFRQADSSTTRAHGGLGLGLSIVRHLVELHGGTVRAESEGEGTGATFTVELPLLRISDFGLRNEEREEPDDAADEQSALRTPHSESLRGLRVLVVDDELDTRGIIALMLRHCGAEVSTAAGADEALDSLARGEFDVLVSDVGMPGKDGFDLIREVRALGAERGGRVPAVALTAHARPEDSERALSEGFHLHLPKPVERDDLVSAVAGLAKRQK